MELGNKTVDLQIKHYTFVTREFLSRNTSKRVPRWNPTAEQTLAIQRQTACYENKQPRTNTNKHETIDENEARGVTYSLLYDEFVMTCYKSRSLEARPQKMHANTT